eukprot:509509_1
MSTDQSKYNYTKIIDTDKYNPEAFTIHITNENDDAKYNSHGVPLIVGNKTLSKLQMKKREKRKLESMQREMRDLHFTLNLIKPQESLFYGWYRSMNIQYYIPKDVSHLIMDFIGTRGEVNKSV